MFFCSVCLSMLTYVRMCMHARAEAFLDQLAINFQFC